MQSNRIIILLTWRTCTMSVLHARRWTVIGDYEGEENYLRWWSRITELTVMLVTVLDGVMVADIGFRRRCCDFFFFPTQRSFFFPHRYLLFLSSSSVLPLCFSSCLSFPLSIPFLSFSFPFPPMFSFVFFSLSLLSYSLCPLSPLFQSPPPPALCFHSFFFFTFFS